jgi:hypothetical protein
VYREVKGKQGACEIYNGVPFSERLFFCGRIVMNMKLGMAALLILFASPMSYAGEIMEDLDLSGTMDFSSHYMFRGVAIVDDPVIQPSASISYKGFLFNFWSNWDLTGDTVDGAEFNEIDLVWGYSTDLSFLTLGNDGTAKDALSKVKAGSGYTLYLFPNWDESSGVEETSHEWYFNLNLDTLLKPFYNVYWDFDQGDGWYHEWGIGHSFDLAPVTVDAGIKMGFNAGQWGFEPSLSTLDFGTSLSVPMDKLLKTKYLRYVTIKPHINYSLPLDDQYEHEVYGGVACTAAF